MDKGDLSGKQEKNLTMRLISSDVHIVACCKEVEQKLEHVIPLKDMRIEVSVLENFDHLENAKKDGSAVYQKSTKKILVNRAIYFTLTDRSQLATLAHEVGHALDHRDSISSQCNCAGYSDDFIVDLLVCRWGLSEELREDRVSYYGPEYGEAFDSWRNENDYLTMMAKWQQQFLLGNIIIPRAINTRPS